MAGILDRTCGFSSDIADAITEEAPVAIYFADERGKLIYANRAYRKIFGLKSDEALHCGDWSRHVHPVDRPRMQQAWSDFCNAPRDAHFEYRTECDGQVSYLSEQIVAAASANGYIGTITDITATISARGELARAEEQHRQDVCDNQALFRAMSRIGGIGGWTLTRNGVQTWSEMIYHIYELPPDEPPPSFDTSIQFLTPELRDSISAMVQTAFEHGTPYDFVIPFITAKGRHRWIRSISEPQIIDGSVTVLIGVIQDVTEQKQLEAELGQLQKLESIGQLAAGIAHEINTPTQFIGNNVGFIKDAVTGLLTLTEAMSDLAKQTASHPIAASTLRAMLDASDVPFLREELPRALEQTEDGLHRISCIVGAMKDFSHPGVDKADADINRAIQSTITVATNEWKYVAEIKTDFDPRLPPVSLRLGSFNQVILNMIVNAAHAIGSALQDAAGDRGCITISTRGVDGAVEVRIHDTGTGIPAAIRDKIFDPFFTTKPVGKGTGQGLAIAHDVIVNKHGGSISLENLPPGHGTTFVIRLPLEESGAGGAASALSA